MINLIIFIIILSILVLFHEFGHYIVAKLFRIKVEEFAIGFPPTLWSTKKGDTTYMINSIPFGGYVKLFGEDGSNEKDEKSFAYKSWWQRGLVISAGIIMNLVLGGICLGITFMIGLPVLNTDSQVAYPYAQIDHQVLTYEVKADSPSANIIMEGDQILTVNDQSIESVEQFQAAIQDAGEGEVNISLKRGEDTINVNVGAQYSDEVGAYQIGAYLVEGQIVKYPFYLAIPMGFVEMARLLKEMLIAFYSIFRDLIVSHQAPSQIAGPVGIYQLAAAATQLGFVYLAQLVAILSINLAIINFLPIPALDGGRLLFIVIEKIRGKKISDHIENLIHTAGFILILGLIVLVTISDIRKFF